jgi:hypothetical protein
MAKVKFSALLSEMRGKLNGSKFSRAMGGSTLLNKVTPINRRSNSQIGKRSNIAVLSQAWSGLTESQRQSWMALALQHNSTNIFGDTFHMSGFDMFIAVNNNDRQIGYGTIITDAPAIDYPTVLSPANLIADSTPVQILTVDIPIVAAADSCILMMTPQVSKGRYNVNGLFKPIKTYHTAAALPAEDVLAEYVAKFGALQAGQKIVCYLKWYKDHKCIKNTRGIALQTVVL